MPLLEAKIVDPTFVTMTALRNAESIASTVLTMETLVEGFQAVPFDESKLTPELMRRLLT